MAPDLTDPKVYMWMINNIEKENRLRTRWTNQHKKLLYKAAELTREPTNYTSNDISKALIVAGLPNTSKEHDVATRHKITKPIKDYQLIRDRTTAPGATAMMPIEKEVKDLLKQSRVEYLKARTHKPPEKKYNFIETTYWKHGWELGKCGQKMRGSAYGRVFEMTHGSRSLSGPRPDPIYYQSPDKGRFCP